MCTATHETAIALDVRHLMEISRLYLSMAGTVARSSMKH